MRIEFLKSKMNKIKWKIFNAIPKSFITFILWLVAISISFLLYRFQRFRFSMVFSGIVILIVLVLFNPIQISVGLIWIAQIFPMSFTISLGGINFRIIDIYMVIVILTWITLYILPSDKIKIIFGWSEFFATLFMIVFVINIFRGLAFHYNQGTSAPTFRSDLVRGPIYYGTLFFFNKIIELKDNIKIILIAFRICLGIFFYYGNFCEQTLVDIKSALFLPSFLYRFENNSGRNIFNIFFYNNILDYRTS